jgi:MraZ protein
MRFRGITKLSVDAKGRLAMPKNHRDKLEQHGITELVVTVDKSPGCLLIYPMPTYDDLEQQVMSLHNDVADARQAQRRFIGYATEVELDGTGRMLLSAELREYAGIERKAYLVGQGNKFELWEEGAWEAECERWKQQALAAKAALPDEPSAQLKSISF